MRIFLHAIFFLATAVQLIAADAIMEIKKISAFSEINTGRLADGEIVSACNSSMKFERGISAQALYIARAPVATTARLLQTWDESKHPELDVFQHRIFHGESDAAFDTLQLDAKRTAVKKFLDLTAAMKPGKTDLLLTRDESAKAPRGSEAVRKFWIDVLASRLRAFQKGGVAGLPALDMKGGKISLRDEIEKLLHEEPEIAARFSEILRDLQSAPPVAPAWFYWDFSSVDGTGALDFGAIYAKDFGERMQVAVADLYVSDGYLTSLTIYELWPLKIGGKSATLVWEISLVSSPELAGGFGVKRKIASGMIQKDMKKSTAIFLREVSEQR
jgi:hypothetical protein